ncbi:hypothetical protein Hanom_Chr10g00895171 [Helianthus anomalus]
MRHFLQISENKAVKTHTKPNKTNSKENEIFTPFLYLCIIKLFAKSLHQMYFSLSRLTNSLLFPGSLNECIIIPLQNTPRARLF